MRLRHVIEERGVRTVVAGVARGRRDLRRAHSVLVLLAALGAALLGSPPGVQAAACNGASHQLTLSNGSVSPGSGTTSTTFTFAVVYSSNAGCEPGAIAVTIPGVGTVGLMAGEPGPGSGTWYRASSHLPAGSWTYRFDAVSGSGQGERTVTLSDVTPGAIHVVAPIPPPTPPPTPALTPAPTRKPPPAPGPTPGPTPASTPAPHVTPGATEAASTTVPDPTATSGAPFATASGDLLGAPSMQPGSGSGPTIPPWGTSGDAQRTPTAGPSGDGTTSGGIPGSGNTGTGDDSDGIFSALVLVTRSPLAEPLVAWALATSGGTGLFGYVLTRRDRRGNRGRRLQLEGVGPATDAPGAGGQAPPPGDRSESYRPSMGMGAMIGRPPMRFSAPVATGVERRTVRYRLVRIGDGPDDVRSLELGRLDRGDEVEIAAWHEGHVRIQTPEGIVGWIASASILGSSGVVEADSDADSARPGED